MIILLKNDGLQMLTCLLKLFKETNDLLHDGHKNCCFNDIHKIIVKCGCIELCFI
jgi:hypothetical protein